MKKVHFIGIAGVGTAPLSILLHNEGWEVSGSDENVFEPMLSLLNNSGIKWFNDGYNKERIVNADLVVIGGSPLMKDLNNQEYIQAKKLGKKIVSFAELFSEEIVKPKSIVVTGSYGKTTNSALTAWLFENLQQNPTFFIGGQPLNFNNGLRNTKSNLSIMEGDEYVSAWGFDMRAKFLHYKPTLSLITSLRWDHVNVYPTLDSYIQAFLDLSKLTFENKGEILLCSTGDNNEVVYNNFPISHTYSLSDKKLKFKGKVHYSGEIIECEDKQYTKFKFLKNNESLGEFETQLIGPHNIENCVASLGLVDMMGFDVKLVTEAMKSFKNVLRRLEVKGKTKKGALIYEDLAHSAVKAKATLEALRTKYKTENITVIFDPHASSLADRKSLEWYTGAFDLATEVIIPSVLVKKSTPKDKRVYGIDIVRAIQKSQPNAKYIPIDQSIIETLKEKSSNDVIVFMSSGGWRGIITEILK